jgi:2-C-methyl-D-erythritol 4-phosphate cytidylyltransferase
VSGQQFALIIPAAGSGKRIGEDLPKPYLEVAGKTIIGHTVSRFAGVGALAQVVIATTAEYFELAGSVKKLLPDHVSFEIVEGGAERQDSIYNAIQVIGDGVDLIAIHDAVRPFVKTESIQACLMAAASAGAAILAVPARDTIKKISDDYRILATPERKYLWQAQTPQIFNRDLIRRAYEHAGKHNYLGTDDASLVEFLGEQVVVVEGSHENFKITYPLDLQLAKLLLNTNQPNSE